MRLILAPFLMFGLWLNAARGAGSFDDQKDVCEHEASPIEQKVIDATAMLVRQDRIIENPNGTYDILDEPITIWPNGNIICSDSHFYGEKSALAGRSGVLIGPDLILTTPHGQGFNPHNYLVVFKPLDQGKSCSPFRWNDIEEHNVYHVKQGGFIINTSDNGYNRYDYVAYQLDRPVNGRNPLKIRRSGEPVLNSQLVLTGHPLWTASKIDVAGLFVGKVATPIFKGDYLFDNIHPLMGSSGGPVFNLKDEVIEATISVGGNAGWTMDPVQSCIDIFHREGAARTNGDITDVAVQLPRYEVLVEPLDIVVHELDLGVQTAQPVTAYNVLKSTLPNGSSKINASQLLGKPASGGPSIISTLQPGDHVISDNGTHFFVAANTEEVDQCGVWSYEQIVKDIQNNQNNYVRHRFELGMKEVILQPEDSWFVSDLGFPYQQTRIYTITNVRPTPTTLTLNAGGGFITINGTEQTNLSLGAAGSPTESANFIVAITPSAEFLQQGVVHSGTVSVGHLDYACAMHKPLVKSVKFARGEQVFSTDTIGLPLSPSENILVDLSGETGYCLNDIDVGISFYDGGAGYMSFPEATESLRVRIYSPDATNADLWDYDSVPGESYLLAETIRQGPDEIPVTTLYLDDELSPPLSGSPLALFNGKNLAGNWSLELQRTPGPDLILPLQVRLKIKASQCK